MNHDNPTLRYFEAEMRYLREAAAEFAEAFPDRAAYLHLDKPGARDPYVERLFEGFAFLMGRLREKLDDDLPELTEGLVSLLWPHYLRTIPSLSVIELLPDPAQLSGSQLLAAGFEVLSQPVGPKGTRCPYSTTADLTLQPITLQAVDLGSETDGRSHLRLRFVCHPNMSWAGTDLSRLPIYLDGDAATSSALHLALTLEVQGLYLRVPGQAERCALDGRFVAGGFGEADGLWPKGDSEFSGYQLLLEYFTFREKFLFVHLHGLQALASMPPPAWFELEVVLRREWPRELPVSTANLRLHCVPVINLFALEPDPLMIAPLQSEYLLRPMRLQDGHTEIFSVDGVSTTQDKVELPFASFTSFRHRGGMLREAAPEYYFHTRLKRGVNGLHDTWLILGGDGFDRQDLDHAHPRQHLSLNLTGTNGALPRKALRTTLLDGLVKSPMPGLRVRNLCPPTLPCYPPDRDRFHWRVLSHLGSNFLSMMDNAEVLRGTLALYDWTHSELNRRRLAAILEVRHSLIQRFEQGLLLRGVNIEVSLDASGFCGEGDINLFGEMLNRFFRLYADVYLFTQLTLVLQPSNECIQWRENHSQRIPG